MNIKKLNEELKKVVENTTMVSYVGDEVAAHAEIALKAIAVVNDLIDDQETIAKLEQAAELLRNMVPHLQ